MLVHGKDKADVLLNWMLNTSYWTAFAEGFPGAVAYGGPTAQMLMDSYNKAKGTNLVYTKYPSLPKSHPWAYGGADGDSYWLATKKSGNSLWRFISDASRGGGYVSGGSMEYGGTGIRPLVRLPAGVKAVKGSDGKWEFSQ